MKNKLLFWVAVGIFIRLIFMPFAGHKDFLASYSRASMIAQGKATIFDFGQPLSHLLQVADLKVFKFVLPFDKLPVYPAFTSPYPETFYQKDLIHRAFFLFKLPYLLAELGAFWLILRLVSAKGGRGGVGGKGGVGDNEARAVSFTKFWMLNPFLIFTTYIYGRYDSLSILILSLMFLAIAKKHYFSSALLLGLSMLARVYTVLFLPVFIILFGKGWKEKAKLLVISLAPYAIWMFLEFVFGGRGGEEWQWLTSGPHQSFFFGWSLPLSPEMEIYPFFVAYFGFLIWLFLKKYKKVADETLNFSSLALVTILLYLSLSFFLPNYPVWVFPFLALLVASNQPLQKLHLIQIAAFFMILPFWNNPLFLRLFSSISERSFFDFPVRGLVSLAYPAQKVIGLGRTLFSTASLYMVFLLLKNEKKVVD